MIENDPVRRDILTMLRSVPGRTKKQKGDAINAITSRLVESLGIAPSDVFIVINEPPLENWGMGGIQKGYLI